MVPWAWRDCSAEAEVRIRREGKRKWKKVRKSLPTSGQDERRMVRGGRNLHLRSLVPKKGLGCRVECFQSPTVLQWRFNRLIPARSSQFGMFVNPRMATLNRVPLRFSLVRRPAVLTPREG